MPFMAFDAARADPEQPGDLRDAVPAADQQEDGLFRSGERVDPGWSSSPANPVHGISSFTPGVVLNC
jgi:hypothetical protein